MRGEIPVCREIAQEMARIDDLIADPAYFYDPEPVEGWIRYCEDEMTLTDGSDLKLLDSFKLWGEQVYGWYYFAISTVYDPSVGRFVTKTVKKRLTTVQYLIVSRGAARASTSPSTSPTG